MLTALGYIYIATKEKLYRLRQSLNPKIWSKRNQLLKLTSAYRKEIISQLERGGYKHITNYSLSTWKYYGKDRVRLTFLAVRNRRKYIIKVTRGFEDKVNNSIRFQQMFNDIFNFIPKGFQVPFDGYVGYSTEYIKSFPFYGVRYLYNRSNIDYLLTQVNSILDQLNEYRIVHCDLETVNVLISKKDRRLYIIDWDTCCSNAIELHCEHFPAYTIKRRVDDDKYLYDDAYSFFTLFERLNIDGLDEMQEFMELKYKIGRNTHVANN